MISSSRAAAQSTFRSTFWLLAFLVLVLGAGAAVGISSAPGSWYRGLAKPSFMPPDAAFAPIWFTAYLLIALAGWLVWMKAPRSPAMLVWVVQLAVNLMWPPAFFILHWIWPPVVLVVGMIAASLVFIRLALPIDFAAGWAFTPYLAWLMFVLLINVAVGVLN